MENTDAENKYGFIELEQPLGVRSLHFFKGNSNSELEISSTLPSELDAVAVYSDGAAYISDKNKPLTKFLIKNQDTEDYIGFEAVEVPSEDREQQSLTALIVCPSGFLLGANTEYRLANQDKVGSLQLFSQDSLQ